MFQPSLVALGVGTLLAAAAALDGAGPIELAPEPRPAYLALGGEMVELAAETHGAGCFAPMLDELRRHPSWSIRIDDLEWSDGVGDERRATLMIDGETATWRDDALPQSLTLTEAERRDVLAAFALDCRQDLSYPVCGNGWRYAGVALGADGPPVTKLSPGSPIAVRLLELFDAIRARYIDGRPPDLDGFSLELAGTPPAGRDDRSRPTRPPYGIAFPGRDAVGRYFETWVRLLDWALMQPASRPAILERSRVLSSVHAWAIPS